MDSTSGDKIPLLSQKSKQPSPLLTALKSICFPLRCLLCAAPLNSNNLHICPQCLPNLGLLQRPICPHCGVSFPASGSSHDHHCAICRQKPWAFSKGRALFSYNEHIAQLIHAFKFQGVHTALSSFAQLAHQSEILTEIELPHHIIPVPLHPSRLRQRGFNQAAVLATALFPCHSHLISHNLQRNRATTPQTGLSGIERRRNVVGSFSVPWEKAISGRKILLVDDVFTTGTTLNECAKTLKRAGASQVEVITLAMVVAS